MLEIKSRTRSADLQRLESQVSAVNRGYVFLDQLPRFEKKEAESSGFYFTRKPESEMLAIFIFLLKSRCEGHFSANIFSVFDRQSSN